MNALRAQAQQQLRVYMSRTGFGLREVGELIGYSPRSLLQFCSAARYGDGPGEETAERILSFIAANPAPLPELPGKLYETEGTREMDRLLAFCRRGGWGTLYGPAGAQKSFLLEYRAAEAAREDEPDLVLVEAQPRMTPRALLVQVARALAAPWSQATDSLRQAIVFRARQRRSGLAVVVDEAQLLHSEVSTLETLLQLGDALLGRAGILLAGNEQIVNLFQPRRGIYFEQWRSRIEQKEVRVLGRAREEARRIATAELGVLREQAVARLLDKCAATDPLSKRQYVNARRLFNTLREIRDARREGKVH